METIGERFKKLRQSNNLSQEDFGKTLGLTKSGVSAVENNKVFVSVNVLRILSVDYNLNLNWLVCGEGNMYKPQQYQNIKSEIMAEVSKMLEQKGIE